MPTTVVKKPGPPTKALVKPPSAPSAPTAAPKPPAPTAPKAATPKAPVVASAGNLSSAAVKKIIDKANQKKEELADDPVQSIAQGEVYEPEPGEVEETPVHQGKPVTAKVTTQHTVGKEVVSQTEEDVPVGESIQTSNAPQANVGYTLSMTRNLGDYNNIKVGVSIHIPCAVDADEIEATYAQAKEWVEEKMNEVQAGIDAQTEA